MGILLIDGDNLQLIGLYIFGDVRQGLLSRGVMLLQELQGLFAGRLGSVNLRPPLGAQFDEGTFTCIHGIQLFSRRNLTVKEVQLQQVPLHALQHLF